MSAGDVKMIAAIVNLQIGDHRRDGRPVLRPNRRVDPAQNFVLAHADVAQENVVRVEDHRDRAGAKRNRFGRSCRQCQREQE